MLRMWATSSRLTLKSSAARTTSPSIWISSTGAPARAVATHGLISDAASLRRTSRLLEAESAMPAVDAGLMGERDLGWMLHDIDFAGRNAGAVFPRGHARWRDRSAEVCGGAGMILQRLAEHYDRIAASNKDETQLAPPGFSRQKISFCVVLEPDGSLNSFQSLQEKLASAGCSVDECARAEESPRAGTQSLLSLGQRRLSAGLCPES
jgi:hypothetical protein